jgi:hypothetical protein
MSKETGKRAASRASEILRDPLSTAKEKSAAASTLTQRKTQLEETSLRVARTASEVLRDPSSSTAAKSAAASALAQRSKK